MLPQNRWKMWTFSQKLKRNITSANKKGAADILTQGRDGKTPVKDKKNYSKNIRGREMGTEQINLVLSSKNMNVLLENMRRACMAVTRQMFGQWMNGWWGKEMSLYSLAYNE